MEKKQHKFTQISDSFLATGLLSLAGGLVAAYTYVCRGEVFANAQTGNMIQMAFSLVQGEWLLALHCLILIVTFIVGILFSKVLEQKLKFCGGLHWRQVILLLEIALLTGVAFIPSGGLDILVNTMIAFACAMQVTCFRKIRGVNAATTMCTGNLRSGTEQLYAFFHIRERQRLFNAMKYYGSIFLFIAGVTAGYLLTTWLMQWAVLFAAGLLGIVFVLLFAKLIP